MKIQLEQLPPNKPNFLKVVLISGVVLLIIFIVAIIYLSVHRGRMERPFSRHPTSQLILPSVSPDRGAPGGVQG